jgi:predicted ArsR family transcriptional regulator
MKVGRVQLTPELKRVSPLIGITGSVAASESLLFIAANGEGIAPQIAKALSLSLATVQRQLLRFEDAGILERKNVGNAAVYLFSSRGKFEKAFQAAVFQLYSNMTVSEKKRYVIRKRPRRTGKPVQYRSSEMSE